MLFSLGLFFQLLVLAASRGRCPSGWTYSPPSGTCLFWFQGKRVWTEANAHCQKSGGDLVSIPNVAMSKFMKTAFKGYHKNRYWIGLNDRTCEGHFRWRRNGTDIQFNYSNWGPGEPDNYRRREHCVELGHHENQKWTDVSCGNKNRYLCEKPATNGDNCPQGWTFNHVAGTCLTMFNGKKTWILALKSCIDHKAVLAKIMDERSADFVTAHFPGTKPNGIWIGLNDRSHEGSYRWKTSLNGQLEWEFLDWQPGQPNNRGNQDCVAVGYENKQSWTDEKCSTKYSFVCEEPPI